MWKLYELIKGSSILIRQFMLPNPFEGYPNADIYNLGAGFALYPVTYLVVGLFYSRGSRPALGSLLYLFFYGVHTGLIALVGVFGFTKLSMYFIGGLYVAILIGLKKVKYNSYY